MVPKELFGQFSLAPTPPVGGLPSLLPSCISFIFLIVDLLWNTADKYKEQNEQHKSAE